MDLHFELDFQLIKLRNFKKEAQEKQHVGFVKTLRLPSSWHGMRKTRFFLQPKTSHLRIRGYSQRSTCELFHLRKKLFHNPGFFGRCWDGKVTQKAVCGSKRCFLLRFQLELLLNVSGATIHNMITCPKDGTSEHLFFSVASAWGCKI